MLMQGDNMDRVIYLLLGEQKIPCQIAGIFGAWVITLRSSRKIFSSRIWTLTDAKILPLLAALMSVYRGCKSPPGLAIVITLQCTHAKIRNLPHFCCCCYFCRLECHAPLSLSTPTSHAVIKHERRRPRPKRIH